MTMETMDGRVADGEQALVSDQAPAGLDASRFDPSRVEIPAIKKAEIRKVISNFAEAKAAFLAQPKQGAKEQANLRRARSWLEIVAVDQCERLLSRIDHLEAALGLALEWLAPLEPGDSRAVSDEFVAMAMVLSDRTNPECLAIFASAMSARRAETEGLGPQAASAVGEGRDAQPSGSDPL